MLTLRPVKDHWRELGMFLSQHLEQSIRYCSVQIHLLQLLPRVALEGAQLHELVAVTIPVRRITNLESLLAGLVVMLYLLNELFRPWELCRAEEDPVPLWKEAALEEGFGWDTDLLDLLSNARTKSTDDDQDASAFSFSTEENISRHRPLTVKIDPTVGGGAVRRIQSVLESFLLLAIQDRLKAVHFH